MNLRLRHDEAIQWLLDGDPAIRWQTLRDLVGASESSVERERRTVGRKGWGARLLARQDRDGTRAGGLSSDGGLYSPKWTSTTYTMLLLSVLEGLRLYELHRGRNARAVQAAQRRGREFLLVHRLFRSHRTGEIIKPIFVRFSFPPRWHYDILRALDYFQAVDAARDPRLAEAIEIVRSGQREDGRWTLQNRYKGKTYFELERLGAASRWNTLRALRVLRWWAREK